MMTRREAWRGVAGGALAAATMRAAVPDWPQWRGPRRDGKSAETGLLKEWPAGGPRRLWQSAGLGRGYGSVALAGERIYVQGTLGRESCVFCLSRDGGRLLWSASLGPMGGNDRGDGPRGTPTVSDGMLYALSEEGLLACLEAGTGKVVWRKHILKDYNGRNPYWLLSESPLLEDGKLLVTPGGAQAGVVALDPSNGREIWRARELSDPAHYASLVSGETGGVRYVTTLTSRAGVGLRLADGKLMWRYTRACNSTANCTTPVIEGNRVFYTSAYGTGGGALELSAADRSLEARELWFSREMMNHHGGVVVVDGFIYGFSNAILTCLELATGKVMWKDRSVGKGSLIYADQRLYLLGENQTAGLAEATPEGYRERGRFQIEDRGRPSWAHPIVCGGRLYLRNQDQLSCYSVAA